MPEAIAAWSAVVGKPAAFGTVSLEGFKAFYGPFGQEIGLQYRMHGMYLYVLILSFMLTIGNISRQRAGLEESVST
jgi:hypothetical protein